MRKYVLASAIFALLLAIAPLQALAASRSPSPGVTPSPSPSSTQPTPQPSHSPPPPNPSPSASPSPSPAPTPDPAAQKAIEQARQQIAGGLADTLAAALRLSDALTQNSAEQSQLQQQIVASQARIDSLTREIQRLDGEIATTQTRIEDERHQIAMLARTLYQSPDSLLIRLLQAGSLRDMVTQTGDLTAAALHAEALKRSLSDDLARLNRDEAQQTRDRQQEAQISEQLAAATIQFGALATQMQQTASDLQQAIQDARAGLAKVGQLSADLAQQLAAILQQREQQLIAITEQQVWQQEQMWAALNSSLIPLPTVRTVTIPGLPSAARFSWPIQGPVLTQGFGPTTLWLEPAMFGFPHFHTGLDLASANTTVTAAAGGVVAVVGSGMTGYGNYVILVHADGFVTLYGHLALTMVSVGQQVVQGQQIGVEGSTGASTGVHLHFEVRLNGMPVDPTPYLPGAVAA